MVKHSNNSSAFAKESFECVWQLCGVGAYMVTICSLNFLLLGAQSFDTSGREMISKMKDAHSIYTARKQEDAYWKG